MFLKPTNTALNQRGLLFRRYTNLMNCNTDASLFRTEFANETKYWKFNPINMEFMEIEDRAGFSIVKVVENGANYFYNNYTFTWYNGLWSKQEGHIGSAQNIEIADIQRTIAERYQKNEYFYVGSFKYITKGSISSSVNQIARGLEIPLESRNIRIDTDVDIREQDIVVVQGLKQFRCYMVENTQVTQKRLPKPFNITRVTLNGLK